MHQFHSSSVQLFLFIFYIITLLKQKKKIKVNASSDSESTHSTCVLPSLRSVVCNQRRAEENM